MRARTEAYKAYTDQLDTVVRESKHVPSPSFHMFVCFLGSITSDAEWYRALKKLRNMICFGFRSLAPFS
jgi:hypothetical protein